MPARLPPPPPPVSDLLPEVNVKQILVSKMDRLASFAADDADAIPSDVNAFEIFNKFTGEIIQARQESMEVGDVLELQAALLRFSVTAYKSRLDYVDHVLKFCAQILQAMGDETCVLATCSSCGLCGAAAACLTTLLRWFDFDFDFDLPAQAGQ